MNQSFIMKYIAWIIYTIILLASLIYIICISTNDTTDYKPSPQNINQHDHPFLQHPEESTEYNVGSINPGVTRKDGVCTKGREPWDRSWLREQIPEFLRIYEKRPGENFQGTPMMHQFALWCIIKMLRPKHIIESGVWNGRGTWLLRQAAPDAQIIVLDPLPHYPWVYVDNNTDSLYFIEDKFRDFETLPEWTDVKLDFSRTLAFIDDHQTPFKRIPQAIKAGIKHMIFEDNYWLGYSDCLSLKQACACLMHEPECSEFIYRDNWNQVKRNITREDMELVAKTFKGLDIYAEFPAIWNVYSSKVTMVSKRSRNYLFDTTSGINLIKSLGLENLPPLNQFNGYYSYCNIAYVKIP